MFEKFHSIDAEKQARILNAAMDEFARNGYANASTNEIVKAAGISKGLLFHYFDNKKQLFLYVYDYCLDISMNELYEQIDFEETDLFAKLRQITTIKLEIALRHPEFFKFIETAYSDQSPDITDDIDQRNTDLIASSINRLFANIDNSKFKDNLDIPKTINIILWSLEGYGQQVLKTAKLTGQELDYATAYHELDDYFEILKNSFYK